ncbi:uncharacterized protein LOC131848086 [Achroia grisella]|uniref:uncharacterized protein LOC131848086 n=1 Tax=Achroia grisella TaxID=688607 RepID=UPI0027D287C8|nr:uncharacterized protein LOC131848086 [Achroia grisella]
MRRLVVFIALFAAAVAAPQYLVHPAYSPGVELEALGSLLDTAEFTYPRALQGHILKKRSVLPVSYSLPSAVSHQSRVDVRTSPAVVATAPVVQNVVAAPVVGEPAIVEARAVYSAPVAVSHQSRVDVRATPAVVAPVVASRAVVPPPAVVAQPIVARSYIPASTVYAGGSAVTHQSRIDVETSPAVVTEEILTPTLVESRSVLAPSVYSTIW